MYHVVRLGVPQLHHVYRLLPSRLSRDVRTLRASWPVPVLHVSTAVNLLEFTFPKVMLLPGLLVSHLEVVSGHVRAQTADAVRYGIMLSLICSSRLGRQVPFARMDRRRIDRDFVIWTVQLITWIVLLSLARNLVPLALVPVGALFRALRWDYGVYLGTLILQLSLSAVPIIYCSLSLRRCSLIHSSGSFLGCFSLARGGGDVATFTL